MSSSFQVSQNNLHLYCQCDQGWLLLTLEDTKNQQFYYQKFINAESFKKDTVIYSNHQELFQFLLKTKQQANINLIEGKLQLKSLNDKSPTKYLELIKRPKTLRQKNSRKQQKIINEKLSNIQALFLSRQKQLETSKTEISILQKKFKDLINYQDQQKNNLKQNVKQEAQNIQVKNLQILNLNKKCERFYEEISEKEKLYVSYKLKINQFISSLSRANIDIQQLTQQIIIHKNNNKAMQSRLQQKQTQLYQKQTDFIEKQTKQIKIFQQRLINNQNRINILQCMLKRQKILHFQNDKEKLAIKVQYNKDQSIEHFLNSCFQNLMLINKLQNDKSQQNVLIKIKNLIRTIEEKQNMQKNNLNQKIRFQISQKQQLQNKLRQVAKTLQNLFQQKVRNDKLIKDYQLKLKEKKQDQNNQNTKPFWSFFQSKKVINNQTGNFKKKLQQALVIKDNQIGQLKRAIIEIKQQRQKLQLHLQKTIKDHQQLYIDKKRLLQQNAKLQKQQRQNINTNKQMQIKMLNEAQITTKLKVEKNKQHQREIRQLRAQLHQIHQFSQKNVTRLNEAYQLNKHTNKILQDTKMKLVSLQAQCKQKQNNIIQIKKQIVEEQSIKLQKQKLLTQMETKYKNKCQQNQQLRHQFQTLKRSNNYDQLNHQLKNTIQKLNRQIQFKQKQHQQLKMKDYRMSIRLTQYRHQLDEQNVIIKKNNTTLLKYNKNQKLSKQKSEQQNYGVSQLSNSQYKQYIKAQKDKFCLNLNNYPQKFLDLSGVEDMMQYDWRKLTTLLLYGNQLSDQSFYVLSLINMPNLKMIDLRRNRLRRAKNISKFRHVTTILLADNGLSKNILFNQTARQIVAVSWDNLQLISLEFLKNNSWNIFAKNISQAFMNCQKLQIYCGSKISSETFQMLQQSSKSTKNIKFKKQYK